MSDDVGFGWMLLSLGLVIAVIGLVLILAPSIPWLGRLPGDIHIQRENFRFYFPLVTCLLVSLVLSLVVWLVRPFHRARGKS
jgi:cell division protein FtsW (lipid II flippase)